MKSIVALSVVLAGVSVLPAQSAVIEFAPGSTTDVVAIRNVTIGGELQDIVFFESTFADEYGTTPPFTSTEATAIESEITAIFNGTSPQSPFFPRDTVTQSTLVLSVQGDTEFHVADFYRSFNPGTGRPDWGSRRGSLVTNGFNQAVWGNSVVGGRELNDPAVFANAVAPMIPEPATSALLAFATCALGLARRRTR